MVKSIPPVYSHVFYHMLSEQVIRHRKINQITYYFSPFLYTECAVSLQRELWDKPAINPPRDT